MPEKQREIEQLAPEKILLGILALLAAERDERVDDATPRKTEVVLAEAGFGPREAAQLTGKDYESVRGHIRRAREAAEKSNGRKRT
jgi:DNA-directed RNA polymerase specialized sigma24 family protein